MKVAAHGVAARLPAGWEGSITGQDQLVEASALSDEVAAAESAVAASPAHGRPTVLPVAHFATFGLPGERGDFGSNVVDLMRPTDAFISLVEYGPEEAGTALFAQRGFPRRLDPRQFSPRMLQRTLAGQAGLQLFFTEGTRAFCLYVVLGDASDAHRLVRKVEQVLDTIEIGQRP